MTAEKAKRDSTILLLLAVVLHGLLFLLRAWVLHWLWTWAIAPLLFWVAALYVLIASVLFHSLFPLPLQIRQSREAFKWFCWEVAWLLLLALIGYLIHTFAK